MSADTQTIYDVGMHTGKDTQYYLDKGFRVVAVEAHPELVEQNRLKFQSSIEANLLHIVPCAVAKTEGTIPFYVFPGKEDWGTLDAEYAQRNIARGREYYTVDVRAVSFASILAQHGIPYYLKIDIEGADILCVEALHRFSDRPKYLSMETHISSFEASFEALAHMFALGYRRFKLVNQAMNHLRFCPNPPLEGRYVNAHFDQEMSGPFGEESPGAWHDVEYTVKGMERVIRQQRRFQPEGSLYRYSPLYERMSRRLGLEPIGWYDLHATF